MKTEIENVWEQYWMDIKSMNKETQKRESLRWLMDRAVAREAGRDMISLYWSQLRKDSQQTIQAMKDRLDSYYMKAAEFDVDNIKQMNEYNQREWASKIEQIDKMMALAQSQARVMQPLTEQEKAQAQAFAGNLYDNEWNFQISVFEMLYKVNPKLANAAVLQWTLKNGKKAYLLPGGYSKLRQIQGMQSENITLRYTTELQQNGPIVTGKQIFQMVM